MSADKLAVPLVILPSTSRGDHTTRDYHNDQFRGGDFMVNQTAQGSTTAFVTVTVQGRVPGTTSYYDVATISPATSTAWTKRVRVHPDASTVINKSTVLDGLATEFLPAIWRVKSTNASTAEVTFSVSAHLYGY